MSIEALLMHTLCITAIFGLACATLEARSKKPEHRANGAQATRNPNRR